jgi:hypothetical protein
MTFNSYISPPRRLALVNAMLDQYYPAPTPPAVSPPADFSQRAESFTGSYLMSRRAETNFEKITAPLRYRVSVVSNPDGTLTIDAFRDNGGVPKRWVEISPLLFQEVGGQSLLAFSADAQDKITAMSYGDMPILLFQKLAWYEDPQIHLAGLGVSLLIFVATLILWSLGGLLRLVRRKPVSRNPLERWGRFVAGGVILLNLVIIGLVVYVLAGDESALQLGYPVEFTVAGILALVSSAGVIGLLACVIRVWRQRAWKVVARLHYTLVVVAALYFIWYLNTVNVLRWPLA